MDSVKVINRRTFPGGSILELEFCDLGANSKKYHRFQWYLIINDIRHSLTFLKMEDNIRYLAASMLSLSHGGIVVILELDAGTLKVGNTSYLLD